MKSFIGWTNLNLFEAKTDATTFFHEVICGIACFDPNGAATIKKGADVKRFFDDGTIEAVNAGLNAIPPENLKQFRFMDDTVDVDGVTITKPHRHRGVVYKVTYRYADFYDPQFSSTGF